MTMKNQNGCLRIAVYHNALTSTNWSAGNRDLTKQLEKINSANKFEKNSANKFEKKNCKTSLHTQSATMHKWESDTQSEKLSQLQSEKK